MLQWHSETDKCMMQSSCKALSWVYAPFLVIWARERWIETEIYTEPRKHDNQRNEEPLFSEEMERAGFFNLEKQKTKRRNDCSHQ